MNVKDMAGYLAALKAVLDIVPGLVEDRHVEKLHRLRSLFDVVLQMKKSN